MQTSNKMAVAPVGKLIWQMSIPPLISMFLQYSYNLIDSAFVARLSENALTAVSLSFPITTLMNAASIWIGVGVNVLIAGYLGQKKQDEANATVTHGLLLAFGIGALLNLLSLLIMKPYFRAFTSNEEIYQLSIAYMGVCSFIANPQYGAYRNPEDDTGHREHDCSYVVSDCGRGGQFCIRPYPDFWYWYFSGYGNPRCCGGYCCGLFVVHDFGVLLCCWAKSKKCR